MNFPNLVNNLPVLSKTENLATTSPTILDSSGNNDHYLRIFATIKNISSDEVISRREVDPQREAKFNEELLENLYDYFSDPTKTAEILLKGANPVYAERLLLNIAIKSDNFKAVEALLQAGIVNEGINGEPTALYALTVTKSSKKMVDLLKKYAPRIAKIYSRMEHVFNLPKGPSTISLKRSNSKSVHLK